MVTSQLGEGKVIRPPLPALGPLNFSIQSREAGLLGGDGERLPPGGWDAAVEDSRAAEVAAPAR
jgi:hypothetical protein